MADPVQTLAAREFRTRLLAQGRGWRVMRGAIPQFQLFRKGEHGVPS